VTGEDEQKLFVCISRNTPAAPSVRWQTAPEKSQEELVGGHILGQQCQHTVKVKTKLKVN
jgi:hypothetical protein